MIEAPSDQTILKSQNLSPVYGPDEYKAALKHFDAAVCEALAVGQETSNRIVAAHIAYGTHVFARICSHATAFIRAAPKSRWVNSDSEYWDFSSIAGHARSIIEGFLLFVYLVDETSSAEEKLVKVNVMHLNDCIKRISLMEAAGNAEALQWLTGQATELRNRLSSNPAFLSLEPALINRLLAGKYLMVLTRDEQLESVSWDKSWFYPMWDVLSQHTHVLPLSFYNMEPNGRGTGILNDTDRGYITLFLLTCAEVINDCVDKMVEIFPDAASVRSGVDSKFSPGPRRNLPKHKKRGSGNR